MPTLSSAALAAVLLASTLAFSVQAQTQPMPEPATQPAPVHVSRDRDPNTMICRHEEETGTRLGGAKTCHTRAEWDQMARDSAEAVENAQMSGSRANVGTGH